MAAAVDHAPPFHKGVETLMNIGDAGDPVPPPAASSSPLRRLTGLGLMAAAGLWSYAGATGAADTARFAKAATGVLFVAHAATWLGAE